MIQTKQELQNLISLIYQNFNMPLFLLSNDLSIIDETQDFLKLKPDYFKNMLKDLKIIKQYKIYTHFCHNEIYFFFYFPLEKISYICIGPYFSRKITSQDHPSDYPFLKHVTSKYSIDDFLRLPYAHHAINKNIRLVYQIITGKTINNQELKLNYKQLDPSLKQENVLDQEIFQIRENSLHEFSYSYEQKMIKNIQNENSTSARILMSELMQIKDGRQLSKNQIQSIKYKLVAAITLFTRAVIDVGVPIAKAYTLSDIYITKIDQSQSVELLYKMVTDSIIDFTNLVKRYKHIQNPLWVKQCKNYISHNLHNPISLNDLANETNMNPSYLSTQFKKVTGQSIKQYINEKKIKEAQFLIKNSTYNLAEISDILQFSSQSHFNKVFKDITGKSPIQFKNS